MQAAMRGNDLQPGPQPEVKSIAEHDRGADERRVHDGRGRLDEGHLAEDLALLRLGQRELLGEVAEDQRFVLRLDALPDAESLEGRVYALPAASPTRRRALRAEVDAEGPDLRAARRRRTGRAR